MMLRVLYIIYFWLIVVPVFLVITILTAVTVIFGCLLGGKKFFAYYPGKIWSWLTCHLVLCPVTVRGKENIDKKIPYVFVANHQGAFDIFLIYGFLGVPIKWVMKAGIGKIPFVGTACRSAGFIFVDNTSSKAAARSVFEAERNLRSGTSIVIFPEGSRSRDGKLARFKKGAYQMAVDQHMQIIPITINGPFNVLPIGSIMVHRHPMELIIHKPIITEGMDSSHKTLQGLAEITQQIIYTDLWEKYRN